MVELLSYGNDEDTIVVSVSPRTPVHEHETISAFQSYDASDSEKSNGTDDNDGTISCGSNRDVSLERLFHEYGQKTTRARMKKCHTAPGNISHHDNSAELQFWRAYTEATSTAGSGSGSATQGIKITNLRVYEVDDESKTPQALHTVVEHNNPYQPAYVFDGTIQHADGKSMDLIGVGITRISVDNLRDPHGENGPTTSAAPIWMESKISAEYFDWYYVESASPSYTVHLKSFMWLAQFTKHIIDYLVWSAHRGHKVYLLNLEHDFLAQVWEWHKGDANFENWHKCCGRITDFRRHFTCYNHAPFITGQAWNIGGEDDDDIRAHPVWDQACQPAEHACDNEKVCSDQTLVTAHAKKCFLQSFPDWGPKGYDLLKEATMDHAVQKLNEDRQRDLGLNNMMAESESSLTDVMDILTQAKNQSFGKMMPICTKSLLDKVILVRLHQKSCYGRPCTCKVLRYAYVRGVDDVSGVDIRVSWLLTPSTTACVGRHAGRDPRKSASAYYPRPNELFWEGDSETDIISKNDILQTFSASTDSDSRDADVVIKRVYHHKDTSFRIHMDRRLQCQHTQLPSSKLRTEKLNVFSIFSGCGLFDSGIEVGSDHLFQTIFRADINGEAIKSAEANHHHTQPCQHQREDVNILFEQYCNGTRYLPDVDCFIAGCPCQGFSGLNKNKDNARSQRNCSLLAHTLSWIELLLPRMIVIENVPLMDSSAQDDTPSTAAGQAICHLVSLGYQAKLVTIRASEFGGATRRRRLFIVATIPSMPLPDLPKHENFRRNNGLATGLASAKSVTNDLDDINNITSINVLHPDHIPCEQLEPFLEEIVTLIPRSIPPNGRCMANLSSAVTKMNTEQKIFFEDCTREKKQKSASTFRRVHPDLPFNTITTGWALLDARGFPKIHWSHDRTISLLELRRFHGVPDNYILLGSFESQLHQLGNSVAYATSTTIGKMLATSWKKALQHQNRPQWSPMSVKPSVRVLIPKPQSSAPRGATKAELYSSSSELQKEQATESDTDEDFAIIKRRRVHEVRKVTNTNVGASPTTLSRLRRFRLTNKTSSPRSCFDPRAGKPLVLLPLPQSFGIPTKTSKPKAGSTKVTAIVIDDD